MHVEVIGPTSGGKSTLTAAIETVCVARGIAATNGDDLVLRPLALDWVRGEFLRRRLVDIPALIGCLRSWPSQRQLCALVWRASVASPGGWSRKLNQARNALRKIGIFRAARRRREGQLVLVDNEGVLQGAHNLFVHHAAPVCDRELASFLALVPLADAVVYVEERESVLLARTLARGHRRIPAGSPEAAARFVARAVRVFETVVREPAIRRRLVVVRPDGTVCLTEEARENERLRALAEVVTAAAALVREQRASRAAS